MNHLCDCYPIIGVVNHVEDVLSSFCYTTSMKDALGQVKALTHVEGNLSCGEHAGSKMLEGTEIS
jgi:hypothetical protein